MNFFLVQVIIPELIFYFLILRFKKKKKIQNQNEKYVLILQRTETIITRILQFG
jgi:preprotein translocase subunit YajC